MSSAEPGKSQTTGFGKRFAEACGSDKPVQIKRLLNISYQAAKNYLGGRLPDARVLIKIGERTPYSIHWLLTGEGEKFSISSPRDDTPVLARQISQLIQQEVQVAVREAIGSEARKPRTIVLRSSELKSEAAKDLSSRTEHLPERAANKRRD